MRLLRPLIAAALIGAMTAPVHAQGGEEPSPGEMAVDALIARPVGLAVTGLGAITFVVSLPFSALGGNVKGAGQMLVVEPARNTFVRCLGCKTPGRYIDPDRKTGRGWFRRGR